MHELRIAAAFKNIQYLRIRNIYSFCGPVAGRLFSLGCSHGYRLHVNSNSDGNLKKIKIISHLNVGESLKLILTKRCIGRNTLITESIQGSSSNRTKSISEKHNKEEWRNSAFEKIKSKNKIGKVHKEFEARISNYELNESQKKLLDRLEELRSEFKNKYLANAKNSESSAFGNPTIGNKMALFQNMASTSALKDALKTHNQHVSPYKLKKMRGLYIWGGVGQGKTVAMDAFLDSLNFVPTHKKKRVHFHSFMADIHHRLHQALKNKIEDPLRHVAQSICKHTDILAFDEFQIIHITDAMVINRLFQNILEMGTLVISTSNRSPDDLYRGGINRDLFTPFIDFLKSACDIHHLSAGEDYRLRQLIGSHSGAFNHPMRSVEDVAKQMQYMAGGMGQRTSILDVQGRTFKVNRCVDGMAVLKFSELCETRVGTEDYMAICSNFHTVFIHGLPSLRDQLTSNNQDTVRRFINCVDLLYENGTRVVFDSQIPLARLYLTTKGVRFMESFIKDLKNKYENVNDFLNDLQDEYLKSVNINNGPRDTFHMALHKLMGYSNLYSFELFDSIHLNCRTIVPEEEDSRSTSNRIVEHIRTVCHLFNQSTDEMINFFSPKSQSVNDMSQELMSENVSSGGDVTFDTTFALLRTISRIKHMISSTYLTTHQVKWKLRDLGLLGGSN